MRGVGQSIIRRLLAFIFLVMPRQTGLDLLKASVIAAHQDFADDAAMAIPLVPIDYNILAEDGIG